MSIEQLLAELTARGVELWVEADRLRFRAPRGAVTPELRAALSTSKAEILARLRVEAGAETLSSPLSYNQQALYFLHLSAPDSAAYNVGFAVRVRSTVDMTALQNAFQALVDRHATLRTTYTRGDDGPTQAVHGHLAFAVTSVDVAGLDEEALRERVDRAYQRPFDLENGPILRVHLFTRSETDHVLLVTLPHIAADGWSVWVLLDELRALYRAQVMGTSAALPRPPVTYTDYVRRQRETLEGPEGERLWDYWREALRGEIAPLQMPHDHVRPAAMRYRGSTLSFNLSSDVSDRLALLAREEGTTLFTVLLAAYQVLLWRYSGQTDVLIGTPTLGRSRSEFQAVVGDFVNTVVTRGDLSGNPSFRQLMATARQTVLNAVSHEDYPFSLLVQRLGLAGDASRSPLFQAMFVFQKPQRSSDLAQLFMPGEGTAIDFGGLMLEPFSFAQQEGQVDLTLEVAQAGAVLLANLKYNTDLFDRATVARMRTHLQTLLEAVVQNLDRSIDDLPLLTPDEHRVLADFNATDVAYGPDACVHQLFEAQVERTPDADAVVFGSARVSYRDLNARANQLAAHLRTLGVGSDVLVGVFMERSVEMVVALLGTLKAGGAYVPLDAGYPPARLTGMLDDARPAVVLTQAHLRDRLVTSAPLLSLDADWPAIAQYDTGNTDIAVSPRHLAYVIYTSGSTGTPKGAMNEHRAVCNRLRWIRDVSGFGADEIVVQKTPFSFDVSVWEFFWPLAVGGRLLVARPEGHKDSDYLIDLIAGERATVVHFVPSMLQVFLDSAHLDRCTSLRHVVCSGEALSYDLQQRFFERMPEGVALHNLYGPTEAAVDVTSWQCHPNDGRKMVPIGRAVPNTQMYVLDSRLHPVPIGVPGELFIGGVQVCRGYWQRPELTAEKFIRDPFSTIPDARLYRTGDLARYLPDGTIEYLGRLDHQVKIRGFRIELGEIESVLAGHSAVKEAVVVVREMPGGDKRLVGCLVCTSDVDERELREHLKTRLPEYMVPSAFVVLPSLPITPNGKLDRRQVIAKAESALEAPRASRSHVAPTTDVECRLCAIWQAVLRIDRVSIDDSFFELGGHSLLVTQVASRIRDAFGVDFPLRTMFEAVTVCELARRIESSPGHRQVPPGGPTKESAAVTLGRADRAGELPLSFTQERLWFIHQLAPDSLAYNIPVAVRLRGGLDRARLQRSWDAVVARHEVLRTTFDVVAGRPIQVIQQAQQSEIDVVDLSTVPPEDREAAAIESAATAAARPFDLARGPVVRPTLFVIGEQHHLLLITMHHIAADQWALGVMMRELAAFYNANGRAADAALPDLPVQYVDYAAWQRQWLQGDVWREQFDYWKATLSGLQPLELPTDRQRPAKPTMRGRQIAWELSEDLANGVKKLSVSEGVTPSMTLLAAWLVVLRRYSGQSDIAIGMPIANRQYAVLEGLIGAFINTLVLRTNLEGNPSFREMLGRVREVSLDAYAHQDLPFEKLVAELQPVRDVSRPPLVQVMFNMLNAPMERVRFDGLDWTAVNVDRHASPFDLSLSVELEITRSAYLEYSEDLFDERTVRQMLEHYGRVLETIVSDAALRIDTVPLLGDAEHRQIDEWNRTSRPEIADSVVALIARQAAERPDALAVACGSDRLTYAELDGQANQLAWHLRGRGVGAEAVVGIFLERSSRMIVALLGVLKTGAAYVPLDPQYPADRVAFMLEDSGVHVLITQESLRSALPPIGAPVMSLDAEWSAVVAQSTDPVACGATARDVAYVIYTSGSTGRPKGVAIEHRGLLNLIAWHQEAYGVTPADRATQIAGTAFDASVWEVWPYLTAGASIHIPSENTRLVPVTLLKWLAAERITVCFLPTPMVEAVRDEQWPADLSLRFVLTGGDRLHRRPPPGVPFTLVNHYGPTENSVVSTCAPVAPGTDSDPTPSIGRPISNTQTYVLDAHLQPVPTGVCGELYVGGSGLARGYAHRPDLTAERFVPNPFSTKGGERLYRTGDVVRLLPDGNLEFIGRGDHQVKLRGFRIELGEIEAILTEHPLVHQAVVVLAGERMADRRLAAYVVAANRAEPPSVEGLRDFLKSRCPEYMVPSSVMVLEAFPVTSNGKIDRRALPANTPRSEMAQATPPRTELERQIAAVWQASLNTSAGLHDNFFDLGGHSLLFVEIHDKLQQVLGREITMMEMFEFPTVGSMAAHLSDAAAEGPELATVASRARRQNEAIGRHARVKSRLQ